ncbi:MAG: TonB-dependent receptor [Erysipelotrichaceae bacterium]|nr:TonB-dependent receptor [Erysipelotrichaceae bacterium]
MIAEKQSASNCIFILFKIICIVVIGFVLLTGTMFFLLGLGMFIDGFRDFTKDNYVPTDTAKQVLKLQLYDQKTEKTIYGILYDDGEISYTEDPFEITVKVRYDEYSSNSADNRIISCVYQEIGHHWLLGDIHQFNINDRIYVFFQLNVNWWTPSDLYVYDEEKDGIEKLYEWDGILITGASPPDVTEIEIMHHSPMFLSELTDVQQ